MRDLEKMMMQSKGAVSMGKNEKDFIHYTN
jgi:hypothetical protein